MAIYLVYGKLNSSKRFKPVDMKENKFVINLIHASMFQEHEKDALTKEVEAMNLLNEDMTFEVRRQTS